MRALRPTGPPSRNWPAEFLRRISGRLPATWAGTAGDFIAAQAAKGESVATRKASQQAIEAFAKALPELLGGSADLTGSVFTNWSGSTPVTRTALAITSILASANSG